MKQMGAGELPDHHRHWQPHKPLQANRAILLRHPIYLFIRTQSVQIRPHRSHPLDINVERQQLGIRARRVTNIIIANHEGSASGKDIREQGQDTVAGNLPDDEEQDYPGGNFVRMQQVRGQGNHMMEPWTLMGNVEDRTGFGFSVLIMAVAVEVMESEVEQEGGAREEGEVLEDARLSIHPVLGDLLGQCHLTD
ncbi:hypothetical protein Dimus_020142 [Dionaea muscipula]